MCLLVQILKSEYLISSLSKCECIVRIEWLTKTRLNVMQRKKGGKHCHERISIRIFLPQSFQSSVYDKPAGQNWQDAL